MMQTGACIAHCTASASREFNTPTAGGWKDNVRAIPSAPSPSHGDIVGTNLILLQKHQIYAHKRQQYTFAKGEWSFVARATGNSRCDGEIVPRCTIAQRGMLPRSRHGLQKLPWWHIPHGSLCATAWRLRRQCKHASVATGRRERGRTGRRPRRFEVQRNAVVELEHPDAAEVSEGWVRGRWSHNFGGNGQSSPPPPHIYPNT